jgi:hypothetical protein
MRVLILYETRRGFTLTVARAIRDELLRRRIEAVTAPVRDVDTGTVNAASALIVGAWTQGMILFKVGPAREALRGIESLPPLDGRPAAVFCTCDVAPRRTLDVLSRHLARHGATVVGGFAFKRKKSLRFVPAYVDAVVPALERAPAAPATTEPTGV